MPLEAPKADIPATGIPRKPLPVERTFISPKKEPKKKSNTPLFLGILILTLVGGSVYLVYFYLPKLMSELTIEQQNKKVQIKDSDWETMLFKSPVFTSLQPSPSLPLDTTSGSGNPNPFAKRLK